MTGILIKRGNSYPDTHREHHVKMKTDTRVILLHTKNHQDCSKPPGARAEAWNRSLSASEGTTSASTSSPNF